MSEDHPPSSEGSSDSWVRRIGRSLAGSPRNVKDVTELLSEAQQFEVIDADALLMMQGVMETAETPVEHIMVPRSQMTVVEKDMPMQDILRAVIDSGHSRFPVIGESRDEVVGILLAKDLLKLASLELSEDEFNLQDYLREPVFVPETKRVNVLLKDFRSSRNHMALVVDEYGGVSGLVTIEDVLETIVGDIDDEHDEDEDDSDILRQDAKRYLVKGLTSIEDFNAYFGVNLSDEEFDTVGGLVTHRFGHLPKRGETIAVEEFQFQVARSDSRRLQLLQVTVSGEPKAADA